MELQTRHPFSRFSISSLKALMAFFACLGFLLPSRLLIDFSSLVRVIPRYVSVIRAMPWGLLADANSCQCLEQNPLSLTLTRVSGFMTEFPR
ncbi:hypothetical protein DSECCO2_366070 [anaerobic digester metagenome]